MPSVIHKYDPKNISNHAEGRFPLKLIRLCLMHLWNVLEEPQTLFSPGSGSPGTGSGPGAALATRVVVEWAANGPFRADTAVDGAWVVTTPCEIRALRLWRGTAGTGGSTVLDVNRRPAGSAAGSEASLYVTQGNRPTLTYNDTDSIVPCSLPDVVALAAGDIVTVDTDTKESGIPRDWRLTLEAA